MTMKAFSVAVLVATAGLGCSESPTSPTDLAGRTWRLVSIEPATGSSTVVAGPARYTIEFVDDTRLSARADCNSCSGPYAISGRNITVGPLACTRAFCGDTSLDTVFTQGLSEAKTIRLDNQLLELVSDARTLKFRSQ